MKNNTFDFNRLSKVLSALLKRTKQLLLWVPVLTLLLGSLSSFYVYQELNRIENKKLIDDSAQRSREIINQLDLLLSNSMLRIQSYEDYIGSRPDDYKQDSGFLMQSLRYTIFQRFTVWRSTPGKSASSLSQLKLLARVDAKGSQLPAPISKTITSELLLKSIQNIISAKEYSRGVLHEVSNMPRVSLVLKSRINSNIIFVFTAPLASLFEKVDLRPGETIDVTDPESGTTWTVFNSGDKRAVKQKNMLQPKSSSRHQYLFAGGLPQSDVKINFRFNFLASENQLSLALIATAMCLLITLIVSYLFLVLVRQNRIVSRLVIEKTQALEHTHQELQDALLGKNRFLGNISHEIRTPLNLILGMIDLCEERDEKRHLSEYLSSMRSSGNHLLSMIEDLLDLAKSETNDLQIHPKKMNLSQFLSEISKLTGQDCHKKGLRFYTHFPANLPLLIVGDPSRLRQILLNLLKNACKYTSSGYVALRVKILDSSTAGKMTLRFEIEDTGVGIPKDKIGKVFDAFFQVESSYVLSEGGVGLGLAIVKELVRKLNGRIDAHSQGKRGTLFEVDLDFEVPDSSSWTGAYKSPDKSYKSILVVSSDPLIAETLSVLGSHSSINLMLETKLPSLIASTKFLADKWFVLDSESPGFCINTVTELSTKVNVTILGNRNSLLNLKPELPIPILDNCPVLASDVLTAVGLSTRTGKRTEKKESQVDTSAREIISAIREDLSLIVADDDLGNQELYAAYFAGQPWKTSYALNGQEAMDLYMGTASDVLILDVRMPLLDGFEVAEKVRSHESALGLPPKPIILVTADALTETVERAARIPGVTFLTKPIRKTVLFETIGRVSQGKP